MHSSASTAVHSKGSQEKEKVKQTQCTGKQSSTLFHFLWLYGPLVIPVITVSTCAGKRIATGLYIFVFVISSAPRLTMVSNRDPSWQLALFFYPRQPRIFCRLRHNQVSPAVKSPFSCILTKQLPSSSLFFFFLFFPLSLYFRFLTYSYLAAFNALTLVYPSNLSYDWQMGSIPLVQSLLDCRNIFSLLLLLVLGALLCKCRTTVLKALHCTFTESAFADDQAKKGGELSGEEGEEDIVHEVGIN